MAGVALVLAAPGVYDVIAFMVVTRTRGMVRVVDPSCYPISGVEPLVDSLAAATAFAVAVVAGVPSARRAAAVEPIVAMQTE